MTVENTDPRAQLIANILTGFNLTEEEAGELADDMRHGTVLARALHWEYFVNHPRLVSRFATLAEQLADGLQQQDAPARWVELLPKRLKPEVQYLYYVAGSDETWGRWRISFDTPI